MSDKIYGFGILGAGIIAPTHCSAIHPLAAQRAPAGML
jgi:hypothetical protein